jgi:hypothetical protein
VVGTPKATPIARLRPIAANNFESDTFEFPPTEVVSLPQVTFVDPQARVIRFSILQS